MQQNCLFSSRKPKDKEYAVLELPLDLPHKTCKAISYCAEKERVSEMMAFSLNIHDSRTTRNRRSFRTQFELQLGSIGRQLHGYRLLCRSPMAGIAEVSDIDKGVEDIDGAVVKVVVSAIQKMIDLFRITPYIR